MAVTPTGVTVTLRRLILVTSCYFSDPLGQHRNGHPYTGLSFYSLAPLSLSHGHWYSEWEECDWIEMGQELGVPS